jgi:hypothetical protein
VEPVSLRFNGLNGATGDYLLPALTPAQISTITHSEKLDPMYIRELKQWWQRVSQPHFAPIEGADPKNLAETGGESHFGG